jgi:hypothetical protein
VGGYLALSTSTIATHQQHVISPSCLRILPVLPVLGLGTCIINAWEKMHQRRGDPGHGLRTVQEGREARQSPVSFFLSKTFCSPLYTHLRSTSAPLHLSTTLVSVTMAQIGAFKIPYVGNEPMVSVAIGHVRGRS